MSLLLVVETVAVEVRVEAITLRAAQVGKEVLGLLA
jgi:hypothetical protein